MGKMPCNLHMQDISSVWNTSGLKAAGLQLSEFLNYVMGLEGVFMAHYAERVR